MREERAREILADTAEAEGMPMWAAFIRSGQTDENVEFGIATILATAACFEVHAAKEDRT